MDHLGYEKEAWEEGRGHGGWESSVEEGGKDTRGLFPNFLRDVSDNRRKNRKAPWV